MFFTYILYSERADRYYIGQTNNIAERVDRHNAGFVTSTVPYIPWKLVCFIPKDTRSEAMSLEKKLKNLSKKRLQDFIHKYGGTKSQS
jgi:putative endonuclease